MALIQRADLVEKIRALFGVVQGQVGGQLVDEIIPVVIVEDVSGPDQVSTQHPLRAMGSSNSAAAVGFLSKVGLQNPPGSNIDIFLERLDLLAANASVILRQGVIAASPSAGIKQWKDRRVDGNPVGIIWDENATGTLGSQVQVVRIVSNTLVTIQLGLTLEPGDSVHIQGSATNLALLDQTFHWIERIRRG